MIFDVARLIVFTINVSFTWLLMYLILLYWGSLPFFYSKQVNKEWVDIFIDEWAKEKREQTPAFFRGILDSYINGAKRDWISYGTMYDFFDTLLIEEEIKDEY